MIPPSMAATVDDLDSYLPANCPNPYYDTWDRHNSIAFSKTKGLRNAPGENNCFLNSAVQVFWHLDVFRRSYRCLTGHMCMGNSCIFCALKVIFTQLQYSDQTSLHPDALRKALAETFANQQRFQLGHMDDAAECFENILRRIHMHIANDCSEDDCTAPHCLPHKKFAMAVCDQVVCPCGASSKPHNFQEMVHYVSANALVAQARLMQKTGDVLHPDRFGLLLRSAVAMGDIRNCPGNCGKSVQIRRALNNCPDVVSVGLVWDSDHPSIEMTTEVARNIGTTILLQDVFHSVMCDMKSLPKLHLVGLVCYYGKHYSTFVFHSKLKVWIYFDDATVKEIGPRWEHVVEKCMRGRYQPLLLLYANPNATPISVETAPKKKVMTQGYSFSTASYDSDSGLDRTHDSIKSMPARRSRTPNPDQHPNPDTGRRAVTPGPDSRQNEKTRSGKQPLSDHKRQPSFLFAVAGKPDPNMAQPAVNGYYSNERDRVMYGGQSSEYPGEPRGSPEEQEDYNNYTLSTKDPYRRPSMNGFDPNNLPLTQGTVRGNESQRKDSFKKGKDKVRSDVIRYTVSPTGYSSSNSSDYSGQQQYIERSLSQPGEDSVSINSDIVNSGSNQHRVVRPKPSPHTYENIDHMTHTPVQSGLATLPRKKKMQVPDGYVESDVNALNRQNSMGNLLARDQPPKSLNKKPVPIPVSMPVPPSGNHSRPPVHDKNPLPDCVDGPPPPAYCAPPPLSTQHQRPPQAPAGHDPKNSSNKTAEGKKIKTKKVSKTGEKKRRKPKEGELVDESGRYIERGMVENILKHQGVQRQASSASNHSFTSNSSIESDSMMGKLLASRNADGKHALSVEIPYDNVSLGSHRDSGYGSSDRNSSSSTGSGTVDPYTQYFITRGMIVPNSINHHAINAQCHSLKSSPSPDSLRGDPMTDLSYKKQGPEQMNGHGQPNSHDHHSNGQSSMKDPRYLHDSLHGKQVLHPIKERSFEDQLRPSPRGTPIPDSSRMLDTSGYQDKNTVPSPIPSPPESITVAVQREAAAGNEMFLSLCRKSDDLMDQCVLAETDGKLEEAQHYCDGAIGALRQAINLKNITHQSVVYAQRRNNSCLLKSRSLQLRMSTRSDPSRRSIDSPMGSRLNVHSSDSETSSQDGSTSRISGSRERLEKCANGPAGPHPSLHPNTGHYRSDSGLSRHDRQNSASSSHHRQTSSSMSSSQKDLRDDHPNREVARSNSDQFNHSSMVHSHTDSNLSMKSSSSSQVSHHHTGSQENLIDIYATLPRRKSKKPVDTNPKDAEVYQSYLSKQKTLNTNVHVEHARTSSGSSTANSLEGRESDSGSSNGRTKLSQSEIRDLLERNYVRRHQEQISQKYTGPTTAPGQTPGQVKPQLSAPHVPKMAAPQTHHPAGQPPNSHPQPHPTQPSAQPGYRPQPETVNRSGVKHAEVGRHQRPPVSDRPAQYSSTGPTQPVPNCIPPQNRPSVPPKKFGMAKFIKGSGNGLSSKAGSTFGSQYLNVPDVHSRPLERSASQPDCQKLVDSSLASTPADRRSPLNLPGRGDLYPSSPWSSQLSAMRPNSASQPDLRSNKMIINNPQDDSSLQGGDNSTEVEEVKQNVSVRALASRFENTVSVEPPTRRNPVRKQHSDVGYTSQRQRSKSESNSSSKNPKSVLKNKKSKPNRGPRKSVTFCEDLARVASLEDNGNGYESTMESSTPRFAVEDRAYYSDDEDRYTNRQPYADSEGDDMDSSNSEEGPPVGVSGDQLCHLCSKRCVEAGSQFCANCQFYMSRMMPSN